MQFFVFKYKLKVISGKLSCHGVVVLLQASEHKVGSSKLYKNIVGICQEGHPEFKVLCYSGKKSGSKVSV